MRLLIISLVSGVGHYTAYLRAVLEDAVQRGWNINIVFNDGASEKADFENVKGLVAGREVLSVRVGSARFKGHRGRWLETQLRNWRAVRRAFNAGCRRFGIPDVVYVVECDRWDFAVSVCGSPTPGVKFVTIPLAVRHHHASMGLGSDLTPKDASLQRFLFSRFLKCRGLACALSPDDALVEYSKKYEPALSERVIYIPDIAELPTLIDKTKARQILHVPLDAKVILVYGCIDGRKGIADLLGALSDERCPANQVALLAGAADERAESALVSEDPGRTLLGSGRLFRLRGWLNDRDTCLAFSCADAAWLGYRGFYNSSGFLWQAARAGLPIIGCREGLIGRWVLRHSLGVRVTPGDRSEVISALASVTGTQNEHFRSCCLLEGAKHTPEHFGATVCDSLRDAATAI